MRFKTRCERCKNEDLDEVRAFATGVFGVDFEHFLPFKYRKSAENCREHFAVRENGELAAVVLNSPVELRVGDAGILAYGVGTVSVREESRGRGYMTDMLAECLIEASEHGAAFSILGGQRQRYEYYGYSLSGFNTSFWVDPSSVRHGCGAGPSRYKLKKAEENDAGLLVSIMQTAPVFACRRAEDFLTIESHDYRTPYLVYEGGKAVGYIDVNRDGDHIIELVLLPGASVRELLLSFYETFGDEFLVESDPFDDATVNELFTVCSDWTHRPADSIAVLDFPKMLNAYGALDFKNRRLPDAGFVIGIESHPFFDKIGISKEGVTHGAFEISVNGGKFSAKATGEKTDITLPYLRAVEYLFTDCRKFYPDSPADAKTFLPIRFFIPSADKV